VGGPLATSVLGNFAAMLVIAGLVIVFLTIVVVKGEPLSG
jgi:hypothetical protein